MKQSFCRYSHDENSFQLTQYQVMTMDISEIQALPHHHLPGTTRESFRGPGAVLVRNIRLRRGTFCVKVSWFFSFQTKDSPNFAFLCKHSPRQVFSMMSDLRNSSISSNVLLPFPLDRNMLSEQAFLPLRRGFHPMKTGSACVCSELTSLILPVFQQIHGSLLFTTKITYKKDTAIPEKTLNHF